MDGHEMGRRGSSDAWRWLIGAAVSLALSFAFGVPAWAQTRRVPGAFPSTTITSDEAGAEAATEAPPAHEEPPAAEKLPSAGNMAHGPRPARPVHHASVSESFHSSVEPTHAMLKLKEDAWAYAHPDSESHAIERVHAGKFLDVTGSTHYFVQVKLKGGDTGFVPISAVELARPEDKVMKLSTDAAVLTEPNRYGKKVSEVHQGHDVHVVGVALNYMKIRMKSGLEGFIPTTAAE